MVLLHLQLMNQDNAIPQSYLQNKINLHAVNNRCTLFEHFCNNFIEPNKNNQKPNNQRLLGFKKKNAMENVYESHVGGLQRIRNLTITGDGLQT